VGISTLAHPNQWETHHSNDSDSGIAKTPEVAGAVGAKSCAIDDEEDTHNDEELCGYGEQDASRKDEDVLL